MTSDSLRLRSIAFRYAARDRSADANTISAETKATTPRRFADPSDVDATRRTSALAAKNKRNAASANARGVGSSSASIRG